ncbi:hypothetical protein RFI_40412, partial [Reticulomyxa filosa]
LKTDLFVYVVYVLMTRENENIEKKNILSEYYRQKTLFNKGKEQVNKSVVFALDDVGLAEQSKHRHLKVLYQLLEEDDRKLFVC